MSTYLDNNAVRQSTAVLQRSRLLQRQLLQLLKQLQQQGPTHLVCFIEITSLNNSLGAQVYSQSLFSDAVLITGSNTSPRDTAELYQPAAGVSCALPQLPDYRHDHTVESSGLLCGGGDTMDTCLQWSPDTGTWDLQLTLDVWRVDHVSWTPGTEG